MHIQYSMSSTGEMRMLTSNNKFIKTKLQGEITLDFLFFFFLFSLNSFWTIVQLAFSGVRAGHPMHKTFLFLSDPVVSSGAARDWRHCECWVWGTCLSPAIGLRRGPLSLLCYNSDTRTRRYFQGNLVLEIGWWWSVLLWIHKCWRQLSALLWWVSLKNASKLINITNKTGGFSVWCFLFSTWLLCNLKKISSKMSLSCFSEVLTLWMLSTNLSVSVILEWRHAQRSLMALCSTYRLTGQGSTAPEADSHKQKLCVYWHQVTTSLSTSGGTHRNITDRITEKQVVVVICHNALSMFAYNCCIY